MLEDMIGACSGNRPTLSCSVLTTDEEEELYGGAQAVVGLTPAHVFSIGSKVAVSLQVQNAEHLSKCACNGETTTGESHDAAGGDGNWVLHPIPGSSGAETWAEWFVPYLKLMAHPAVKAACYIDWNWRDTTNDHEFSW